MMQTGDCNNLNVSGKRSGYDRRVCSDTNYQGIEKRTTSDRRMERRKRKHKRFLAKNLAFVKLRSESEINVGKLLDISKAGLSFHYIVNGEKLDKYYDLGIFLSGGGFYIDQIPFRTASNIELADKPIFSTIILRRYSVQFKELTPDQSDKLDYFLRNHTVVEV